MQPRPSAETSRPLRPSFRVFIRALPLALCRCTFSARGAARKPNERLPEKRVRTYSGIRYLPVARAEGILVAAVPRRPRLAAVTALAVVAWIGAPRLQPATAAASPADGASLQQIVASGRLSDLRWPDFSDYEASLASFYGATGYAPAWIVGRSAHAAGARHDRALQGRREEGSGARGLRRLPMGRPHPGPEGGERRSRAIRRRPLRLHHAVRVRPSHWPRQSPALRLRPERRREEVRPRTVPPGAAVAGTGPRRALRRRRAALGRLSPHRSGPRPVRGARALRRRTGASVSGQSHSARSELCREHAPLPASRAPRRSPGGCDTAGGRDLRRRPGRGRQAISAPSRARRRRPPRARDRQAAQRPDVGPRSTAPARARALALASGGVLGARRSSSTFPTSGSAPSTKTARSL